jgi:hypothetical protein
MLCLCTCTLFIVANVQAEYLEPVIDTRVYQAQRMRLTRSPEQVHSSPFHYLKLYHLV